MKNCPRFSGATVSLALALAVAPGLNAATPKAPETVAWITGHLPGLIVEGAVISHSGMDQGCLFIKTGGTTSLRGYYVFKIDLLSLKPGVRFSGDQKNSTAIDLEASNRGKIVEEVRYMDGSTGSVLLSHLPIDCATRPLAEEMQRAFEHLIGLSAGARAAP